MLHKNDLLVLGLGSLYVVTDVIGIDDDNVPMK